MAAWLAPALSVVGGLLGQRKQKLPKETKNLMRFQYSIADQMRRLAQQTPLTGREDAWALANAQGRLGEQQKSQREQIFSGYNPDTDAMNRSQLMMNVTNEQIGQRMALESQHLLAALQNRREYLSEAARTAAGASPSASMYGADQGQGTGLSAAFGALAQQLARQQELKQQSASTQGATTDQRSNNYNGGLGGLGTTSPAPATAQGLPGFGAGGMGGGQPATPTNLGGQMLPPFMQGAGAAPAMAQPQMQLPPVNPYGTGGGMFQGPAPTWGGGGLAQTQGFNRKWT